MSCEPRRFRRQLVALVRKNLCLLARHRLSTAVRLFACVFFMILMKVVVVSINVANENTQTYRLVR